MYSLDLDLGNTVRPSVRTPCRTAGGDEGGGGEGSGGEEEEEEDEDAGRSIGSAIRRIGKGWAPAGVGAPAGPGFRV
jgi:hypothetical protein